MCDHSFQLQIDVSCIFYIQLCRCCDNLFKVLIARRIGVRLTEFSSVHVAADSQEIMSDTELQSV